MKHKDKKILVLQFLHKNISKNVSTSDFQDAEDNIFSENELEIILEDLCYKGIVSSVPSTDADGTELPFYRYRLTSEGLTLIEEIVAEDSTSKGNVNPYPRIFKNTESFQFFESLRNEVREQYKLADYSFIYRRMQKDGYIFKNIVDSEFRDFLEQYLSVEIDKTKLLEYCKTDSKENNYSTKKLLFKLL